MEKKITVGSPAPDFTLPDETGALRTLSSLRGNKVVLYFYPKDDTPGCRREACSIRDDFDRLQAAGIIIWGVSYDSPESHTLFKEKYHLPFSLLSDEHKQVAQLYGVNGWLFAKRVTFLIDEQGIIIQILTDIDVSHHANQILHAFGVINT